MRAHLREFACAGKSTAAAEPPIHLRPDWRSLYEQFRLSRCRIHGLNDCNELTQCVIINNTNFYTAVSCHHTAVYTIQPSNTKRLLTTERDLPHPCAGACPIRWPHQQQRPDPFNEGPRRFSEALRGGDPAPHEGDNSALLGPPGCPIQCLRSHPPNPAQQPRHANRCSGGNARLERALSRRSGPVHGSRRRRGLSSAAGGLEGAFVQGGDYSEGWKPGHERAGV